MTANLPKGYVWVIQWAAAAASAALAVWATTAPTAGDRTTTRVTMAAKWVVTLSKIITSSDIISEFLIEPTTVIVISILPSKLQYEECLSHWPYIF